MMEILLDNLLLVLGAAILIAAFVRHMMTKDRGANRSPDDDYDEESEDWWMNPGNDMGFFERHDD